MNDAAALKAMGNEIHVWIATSDNVHPRHLIEEYLPLLNLEELERYQRFHFDHDRHTYLAAHALVRIALSHYAACKPGQWRFMRGEQGKPEIEVTTELSSLRFNLSHTQGMVACIIGLDRVCGIDVECVRPLKDMMGIAEAVFSLAENAYLDRRAADQADIFFKLWTLKEAYIKAIGQGLSAPLKEITFDIREKIIQATFTNELLTDAGWQFHHGKPTASHYLSIAVQSQNLQAKIICHELPLDNTLENNLSRACSDFQISTCF